VTESTSHLAVYKIFFYLLVIVFSTGCVKNETDPHQTFVGKWESSRLVTPLYLHANGEWEIKKDDGAVVQYGVWEYKRNAIIWTHKSGSQVSSDTNAVIQVQPSSFHLRESDGTITTFKKMD
jgi:hypothetical protein